MRVGIIGGGQLGRMLILAGVPLGDTFTVLDPDPHAPAFHLLPDRQRLVAPFNDPPAVRDLFQRTDVVTFEFENVPPAALDLIESVGAARTSPPAGALRVGQDRGLEKQLFRDVGLAVPDYRLASSPIELEQAVRDVGTPCVVKTRRMGYDGKGQAVVRSPGDLPAAIALLALNPFGVIVESFVAFEREISIVAVRARDGSFAAYPIAQNTHERGILRRSLAPASTPELQGEAETHARAVMERLGYAGVLAIEFFVSGANLLGNEMAPRVHNSGHWTIEGAVCSQFENHLRAITGRPLGETTMHAGPAAMINLVGLPRHAADDLAAIPGAHVHWYGKEARPERKVGHITLVGDATRHLAHAEAIAGWTARV
ncbi:MAG: 5-(carboxyamino)imidazole ribonucleotide synthase [Phycisphaeraceae bacterium]|nr:MAG: 5-(carboxyamino)imidazole ribonucleotide synthase [Phycisphaeraceae bacterium]